MTRTYADGIEDAARVADWREPYRTMDASGSDNAAEAVGWAWIKELAADEGPDACIESPPLRSDGRAIALYHSTKLIALATVFRDPMNFAVLVRWKSEDCTLSPSPSGIEDAREALTGWRLIDDGAPKDGTEILLYGPVPSDPDRVTAGFWCEPEAPVIGDCGGECRCPEYGEAEDPFWCTMHGGSDAGWMSNDGGFTTEYPPTHWMPLPAPPLCESASSKIGGDHG